MDAENPRAWLKLFLRPLAPTFREVLVMSFFVNVLALAVPIFVLQVYDRVVFHAGISTLQGLVIGMFAVLAFDYMLRQTRARVMQTVALRVDVEIGKKLFEKVTALPLQTLESKPAAHWQSLFRDVDMVRNTLSGASALLVADLPFAFLFLGLIFVIAGSLAWVLIAIMIMFMVVAYKSAGAMSDANHEERESTQARDGLVAEMINGRATIKALALDSAMRPEWQTRHADNIERSVVRGGKADLYSNFGGTITMISSIAMTSVGATMIINQELTMGSLIATNMLSGRLLGPMNQLVGQWRTYSTFRDATARLGELFALESERTESEIKLDRPKGKLELEDISFTYAEDLPPVVNHLSVTFDCNAIHAVVGRNGCGKSTVLKLVQGLYKPLDGRVTIDGADISQFTRQELAVYMGYVPQDCVLFQGTVRDNIAHRVPDASDEQILEAAKASGVHQFIIDMPDGYATDIGEAGRRLSGGQRQRIAIARALVGDPPVLMFDEPSASLDRQAEAELRKTLKQLGKNRTVIIVTHSPALLQACDFLVALDKGKVALAGPASEILPRMFGKGAVPKAKTSPPDAAPEIVAEAETKKLEAPKPAAPKQVAKKAAKKKTPPIAAKKSVAPIADAQPKKAAAAAAPRKANAKPADRDAPTSEPAARPPARVLARITPKKVAFYGEAAENGANNGNSRKAEA